MMRTAGAALLLSLGLLACPDQPSTPMSTWSTAASDLDQALMAVAGTSSRDVWVVGATRNVQDPDGPLVLHWDGAAWTRHVTGQLFDVWWVHPFADGTTYFGGAGATILQHEAGTEGFTRMPTPGVAAHTVYGLWGAAPDDVWAVGGVAGRSCFVWHFDGEAWGEVALPDDLPRDAAGEIPACLKVFGRGAGDVWVVGGAGLVMRAAAGGGPLSRVETGSTAALFTVHGGPDGLVAVGGASQGAIFDLSEAGLVDRSPPGAALIQGVHVAPDGAGVAVGVSGAVFARADLGAPWRQVATGQAFTAQSLHAVWQDPDGGVWAVGGNVLSAALDKGAILHMAPHGGAAPLTWTPPARPEPPAPTCPEASLDRAPDGSIARRWNELMLRAIARDLPRPVVHARNLFHVSVALWDAYAAFDPALTQVFAQERAIPPGDAEGLLAAREAAMSHAAYRVLVHRYANAVGGPVSAACFRAFMDKLGHDPDLAASDAATPEALGDRIGRAIVEQHRNDGANEAENYKDTTGYTPANRPLVVDVPGTRLDDWTTWQQLNLAVAETQNGLILDAGVQGYIGAHWKEVTPFALTRTDPDGLYLDPGPPPSDLAEARASVVRLLRVAAKLDPTLPETLDISPGALGNAPLGTDDGEGHAENPFTGEAYAPNVVRAGDFYRVMAEYWADGPDTETPPGHWNTIANQVADHPEFSRRLFGEGPELTPLDWDVRLYLALNGAMHDAAIVAWQLKRVHLGPRPISLIRWMASNGQSSDPAGPGYHADGLPLEPGLLEVVTAASAADGERHAHLRPWMGEVAVFSWRGEPGDRKRDLGGVGWVRAKTWMPFQRRTFVTPAFPGFVSGHSTFSRAGAETLAQLTGTPFFPGGIKRFTLPKGAFLFFENGPSEDLEIQWATYYDAADQCSRSRIFGGIHIDLDDYPGRRAGHEVATRAVAKAQTFWSPAPAR